MTATVVQPLAPELSGTQKWRPVTGGTETTSLLQRKLPNDAVARAAIAASAAEVLGNAFPPGVAGQETGLVVGYVQSGKTLSFTTVAALARDNAYPLVIVIAGSSIQLSGQSRDRIRKDLAISPDRPRTWALFHNPKQPDAGNIQRILDDWQDTSLPRNTKQTVLVTVMKQHQNLNHLNRVLRSLNLANVSALIIDDEADQASLNNEVPDGSQSTTYQRILQLRALLPAHTLLQYTATPQAPLLINIIDTLSPKFVEVLDPGAAYTGGIEFFREHPELVRNIPAHDVPTPTNPLDGAPETLLEALRFFLLGVAAGLKATNGAGNRSMLVHPSYQTAPHQEFVVWISDVFEEWRAIVRRPNSDADRADLLAEFRASHDDLARTAPDLPTFDELVPFLGTAFNRTNIEEVNRRQGRPVVIEWERQYAWILVGGAAMDRGYTVEGLTVTYMPRGVGTGQADTVQQRARFFGYKREYLGLCRVYLQAQTVAALRAYVEHEEYMRNQLKRVVDQGLPLDEWKRAFVLDPSLKPCRDSVLEFDYVRGLMVSDWWSPHYVIPDAAQLAANQEAVNAFLAALNLAPDAGNERRTEMQRHRMSSQVSLRHAVETLITRYRVRDPIDSQRLIGVLVQLALALENGADEMCSVYQMSSGIVRERGVDEDGKVSNLYQGAAPVSPKALQGSVYPGDQGIHAPDAVTIQVHSLRVLRGDAELATSVPVIAIWIPPRLARPWLIQHQPPQDA